MLTDALESSLWEVYTHKMHYHAAVTTLASIFEEAFTKTSYELEDFMDHTYLTVSPTPLSSNWKIDTFIRQIFDSEVKKKVVQEPAVNDGHDDAQNWAVIWSVSEQI